jgi:hypothetical protein
LQCISRIEENVSMRRNEVVVIIKNLFKWPSQIFHVIRSCREYSKQTGKRKKVSQQLSAILN